MVLLIGNYPPDQQQSMQRFNTMMLRGLTSAGLPAELIQPEPFFGSFFVNDHGPIAKWFGYLDKYILFPFRLRKKLRDLRPAIIHILDHSNAVYAGDGAGIPVVVTCHDLLAVRGALGEQTDCPASFTGRILQRWILGGLRRAHHVACVSRATAADAERLVGNGKISVVYLGLNYPYRKLDRETARAALAGVLPLDVDRPFVLHVGSNLRRKNREGALRIFALSKERWNGQLVFAGDRLSAELLALAGELGIEERIVQVENPDNQMLEILYNTALALLYPSRFEGFGWPIIEAQSCGCPVLCSTSGPLPEVAGEAGLFHEVEDERGFADDLLRLLPPGERGPWSEKSLRNAERFSTEKMIGQYIDIYRQLGANL